MPRASLSGYSNADAGITVVYGGDESSVGISSLTSERTPDKSGTSSGTDPQSPALTTDSPSFKDLPPSPESSSAPSTGGSGRVTSSGRPSPQASSADSVAEAPVTQDRTPKGGKRGSSS